MRLTHDADGWPMVPDDMSEEEAAHLMIRMHRVLRFFPLPRELKDLLREGAHECEEWLKHGTAERRPDGTQQDDNTRTSEHHDNL